VIETQQGGNFEIRRRDRSFVDISEIDVSAFPLTRSRALHFRISEIANHEGVAEELFGISENRSLGIQGFW
jgi:hypothetical protein